MVWFAFVWGECGGLVSWLLVFDGGGFLDITIVGCWVWVVFCVLFVCCFGLFVF